jgi:hypothetical protein
LRTRGRSKQRRYTGCGGAPAGRSKQRPYTGPNTTFGIALASRSSRIARSRSRSRSRSALVTPGRRPWSTSSRRSHSRRVSGVVSSFPAMDWIAAQSEECSSGPAGDSRHLRRHLHIQWRRRAGYVFLLGNNRGDRRRLLAALSGCWDWLHIPGDTRARAIGAWHGGGNVVVVVLFIVSWLLRREATGPEYRPNGLPFVLEVVGVLLALVTGWLGGELVKRLGVGVDEGAHLNVPNSPSDKSAHAVQDGRSACR